MTRSSAVVQRANKQSGDTLSLILLRVLWLLRLRKSYGLQFLAVACNHSDMVLRRARDVTLVRGNSDGGPILRNHGDGGAKCLKLLSWQADLWNHRDKINPQRWSITLNHKHFQGLQDKKKKHFDSLIGYSLTSLNSDLKHDHEGLLYYGCLPAELLLSSVCTSIKSFVKN